MRYNIFSNDNVSPLKINSMGFSGDKTVTRFGAARRNSYIIHYVTKGKGYYNGSLVTEGQGFLIYPGQLEEYHADISDPWEFLWIISSDDAVKDIFVRYNANPDTLVFDYDSIPTVKNIANKIISKNNHILDSLEILEMFLHIFNSHACKKMSAENKLNSEIYLDFCLNYIESNLYKKISINELTTLLGVSQPYLYKIFNNKFNMSAKQYIIWYKIDYAKKLLRETDMTITQIANSVGYSDILTFSRMFSLKEKISPQKYRVLTKDRITDVCQPN